MKPLSDQVAIVTGGSRGIGRAIALRLGADGADVVVNFAQDQAAAAEVVAAIREKGSRAIAVQARPQSTRRNSRLAQPIRHRPSYGGAGPPANR